MPAINASHCFLTYHDLVKISSARTFCAGFENERKGPCTGDGGSGYYMRHTFSSHSPWNIRGIASASLIDIHGRCDVNKFSVFTNIAWFVEWITEIMSETEHLEGYEK